MNNEELIKSLDMCVPKNPKSDWGKWQRRVVDKAITVLSTDGEYIKKEDIIEYLNDLFGEMYQVSFSDVLQSIDSLQTYSFPDLSENKGDLISRRALIEGFADMREGYPIIRNERITVKDVIEIILSIPPVEDKGEWNVSHTDIDELWATCSNCDEEIKMRLTDDYKPIFYNFCPNCGADMRGNVKSFYDRMTEELGENWDMPADMKGGE